MHHKATKNIILNSSKCHSAIQTLAFNFLAHFWQSIMHLMIQSSVTLRINPNSTLTMTNQQDNQKKPHLQCLKQCHNEESAKNDEFSLKFKVNCSAYLGEKLRSFGKSLGLVTASDSKTRIFVGVV